MIDLDELERLEREATPGPWGYRTNPHGGARVQTGSVGIADVLSRGGVPHPVQEHCEANARLIAATRNALPDLIAELRTLRARVAEMESPPPLTMPVRTAARKRFPLDGADAQALEGALRITEQERDEALARVAELEEDNEWLRGVVRTSCVHKPTPGCDCPGCETARERADQVNLVASYEAELEEDRQGERDRILGARVRELARQHHARTNDARHDLYGFAWMVMRAMEEEE